MPSFTFNMDLTAMRLHDAARNGKPQPGSTCGSAAGFFPSIEAVENVGDIFNADALARICNAHFHALTCPPRFDLDLAVSGCVTKCIGD